MSKIAVDREFLDCPKVILVAKQLNIDEDSVVGKSIRLVEWFDRQVGCGPAPVESKGYLDRFVGVEGFCEAMIDHGFLEQSRYYLHAKGLLRYFKIVA